MAPGPEYLLPRLMLIHGHAGKLFMSEQHLHLYCGCSRPKGSIDRKVLVWGDTLVSGLTLSQSLSLSRGSQEAVHAPQPETQASLQPCPSVPSVAPPPPTQSQRTRFSGRKPFLGSPCTTVPIHFHLETVHLRGETLLGNACYVQPWALEKLPYHWHCT